MNDCSIQNGAFAGNDNHPRFALGVVVLTEGVGALQLERAALVALLHRHQSGDWGLVCNEDREVNEAALRDAARLMSVYDTSAGRVWLITEADRSGTTVLLPEEY